LVTYRKKTDKGLKTPRNSERRISKVTSALRFKVLGSQSKWNLNFRRPKTFYPGLYLSKSFFVIQKVVGTNFRKTNLYTFEKRQVCDFFYIHVTVHRNRYFLNNQPDAPIIQIFYVIKLYMFRSSSLPIIRSFLLFHPDSTCKRSSKTCLKLTSAECTVENSW